MHGDRYTEPVLCLEVEDARGGTHVLELTIAEAKRLRRKLNVGIPMRRRKLRHYTYEARIRGDVEFHDVQTMTQRSPALLTYQRTVETRYPRFAHDVHVRVDEVKSSLLIDHI